MASTFSTKLRAPLATEATSLSPLSSSLTADSSSGTSAGPGPDSEDRDSGEDDEGGGQDDEPTAPNEAAATECRKPRRWKMLEIFTWTMAVTAAAVSMGWEGLRPISIETGFDLYERADHVKAWERYVSEDLNVAVCAFRAMTD